MTKYQLGFPVLGKAGPCLIPPLKKEVLCVLLKRDKSTIESPWDLLPYQVEDVAERIRMEKGEECVRGRGGAGDDLAGEHNQGGDVQVKSRGKSGHEPWVNFKHYSSGDSSSKHKS